MQKLFTHLDMKTFPMMCYTPHLEFINAHILGLIMRTPNEHYLKILVCDNSHIYCSNEQCEGFLPIYTWKPFQWCATLPIWSSLMHTFPIFNYWLEIITCFKTSMGDNSYLLFKCKMSRLLTHSHVKIFPMICSNFHLEFISKVKQIVFSHYKMVVKTNCFH
jgi:hypothetical protein